jgi:hypothetical protein
MPASPQIRVALAKVSVVGCDESPEVVVKRGLVTSVLRRMGIEDGCVDRHEPLGIVTRAELVRGRDQKALARIWLNERVDHLSQSRANLITADAAMQCASVVLEKFDLEAVVIDGA